MSARPPGPRGRRRFAWLTAIAVGISATVSLAGLWSSRGDGTFRPIDPAAADLGRGARLYAEHCAACHGADLEGQPDWQSPGPDGILPAPPHDASGHTWHHDDRMLFDYTRLGGKEFAARRGIAGFRSGMPGFGDRLDDGQIRDILAFIESRWPAEIRELQRETTRRVLADG